MSWINDVRDEIRNLDVSRKSLRKFGLSVGAVFCLLAIWMTLKNNFTVLRETLGIGGALLLVMGLSVPQALTGVYKVWMGMAFAAGWIVSRVLLVGMFYLVLTPIGLLARLSKKKFLYVDFEKGGETYWITKNRSGKNTNYEKMY